MRTIRFLAIATLTVTLAAQAQDAKKPDAPTDAKKVETKEAKKAVPITAIVGADVYTVTKGVIRNGVVLVQDGKILRVGQDVPVPEGATRIDATGKVITPGFVTVSATGVAVRTLGNAGGGPGAGGAAAQGKFADALN